MPLPTRGTRVDQSEAFPRSGPRRMGVSREDVLRLTSLSHCAG
jgi:hypothetical protein